MKILLTGSEGFVGGYLRKKLELTGHVVYCIDRVKVNRSKYRIKDIYWKKEVERVNGPEGTNYSYVFSHHHIIISNIEEDGVFFVMNDHKEGRMGQIFRYKFQIQDYNGTTKLSDCKFELLDKRMTMIR